MAQEVQILVLCDWHLRGPKRQRIDATYSEVITVGGESRKIELCDECVADKLAPMLAVLSEFGEPVSKAGKAKAKAKASTAQPQRVRKLPEGEEPGPDDNFCPACRGLYGSRGSLMSHARDQHESTLRELELQAGREPTGEERTPRGGTRLWPEERVCPECTAEGAERPYTTNAPQGMGAHRRSHGVVGGSDAPEPQPVGRAQPLSEVA